MVYIYKKIIRKKPYYYLRASQKKGKKLITKDIAYLGNNIEDVKKALDKLPDYKTEIRKAYRKITKFLDSNYYFEKAVSLKLKKDDYLDKKLLEIEAYKIHFNKTFKKLDELTRKEIVKNFVIEFAYNTTSMEGNTIGLEETRNLLEEGRTPKNKTLREIYDLKNHEKVFFEIFDFKKQISHDFIIDIHSKLMSEIDKRIGYRTRDVRVFRSYFKSTPGKFVKTDIDLLLRWYDKNKEILHPFVLACIFHHKFEKIHPFMDGNGRTGRMLFNYILMRNNYPPVIVHKKTRTEYLEVLGKADNSGLTQLDKKDYLGLVQYMADEMIYYWDVFL